MTAALASMSPTFNEPEYRVEGPLKVTGRARYSADVRLPGMLWARFAMSRVPHARIVSINTSAALDVPGVHAVLTGGDIGPRRFGRVLYDWPVLAYDRVRFIGERVATVAAETREAAEEAASLVHVEYEELPAVFDAEEALADGAPILHPPEEAATYHYAMGVRPPIPHPNVQGYRLIQKGDEDIERVFAQCDRVFEEVYTAARQHQGFIEPRACVVWIEPDGTVQVVSTNKAPFSLRHELSLVTGLPAERIVVENTFIGGDFGGKGHSIEEFACYFLAQATGRPVKAVMTYAEELGAAVPRHGAKFYVRTGVTREGRIVAHEVRAYYNDGAYAAARPLAGPILDGWSTLDVYNVPNARLETFVVYTNLVPGGQMRAPGAAHTHFVGESHVDHIAHELDMDPLEFRIRNALRPGDTNPTGEHVRNPRAVEVLETLRRETSWGQKPLPPNHGRGVVLRSRHVGEGQTEVILRLLPQGMIEALYGAPDQGGGSATVVQRVASAVLSVDPGRIRVRYGSTAEAPPNPGAGASRTTHIVGQATIAGARNLKEKLEELAAEVMGWPAGRVALKDDRFVVTPADSELGTRNSESGAEWARFEEVAARILRGGPVEAHGAYDSAEHHHAEGGDFNFCAYMLEVEVDRETGRVRPTDGVLVVDVGTIINPLAHQGQLEGGFVFGLGNALMEEVGFDDDGRVTTLSLGDYKLPTHMDVPPLRTVLVPTDIGPGPFGAKGIGETTNNAVAPAVANAVCDAIGKRIRTMPITAERVLDALRTIE